MLQTRQKFFTLVGVDETHGACWIGHISSDCSIDLVEMLLADLHLVSHQRILKSVPEEDAKRQAVPQVTSSGARLPHTSGASWEPLRVMVVQHSCAKRWCVSFCFFFSF